MSLVETSVAQLRERWAKGIGRSGSWGRGTSTVCYRDTKERHAEGIETRDVISDCGMWEACRRRQHPRRMVSGGSQRKEGAQRGSSQEKKGLEAVQEKTAKFL